MRESSAGLVEPFHLRWWPPRQEAPWQERPRQGARGESLQLRIFCKEGPGAVRAQAADTPHGRAVQLKAGPMPASSTPSESLGGRHCQETAPQRLHEARWHCSAWRQHAWVSSDASHPQCCPLVLRSPSPDGGSSCSDGSRERHQSSGRGQCSNPARMWALYSALARRPFWRKASQGT